MWRWDWDHQTYSIREGYGSLGCVYLGKIFTWNLNITCLARKIIWTTIPNLHFRVALGYIIKSEGCKLDTNTTLLYNYYPVIWKILDLRVDWHFWIIPDYLPCGKLTNRHGKSLSFLEKNINMVGLTASCISLQECSSLKIAGYELKTINLVYFWNKLFNDLFEIDKKATRILLDDWRHKSYHYNMPRTSPSNEGWWSSSHKGMAGFQT